MKQILFLLLFPCFALAQYTGNAGQKITLGEQTTADGLVYRGVANDTALITPFSDTSAYIILDTVNSKFYHYNRTTTYWSLAGGGVSVTSFSAGTTGLTPSTATTGAVTLGGTLAVANGGTGATTFTAGNILFGNGTTNINNSNNLFWDNVQGFLGVNTNTPNSMIEIKNTSNRSFDNYYPSSNDGVGANIIWSTNTTGSTKGNVGLFGAVQDGALQQSGRFYFQLFLNGTQFVRMNLDKNGNLYIGTGTTRATEKLHVAGNARITAMNGIGDIGADANGVLQAATSDMNLKNTIENSPFGLNEILLLNPVTFLYNDINRKIDSDVKEVGFIAQDVFDIIPNAVSSTGTGDLQLDYRAITTTLVKAIQEQNTLIKALEQRILTLENK